MPSHLHGLQKDLLQDWSFEPRSVWQNKPNDSLPGNEKFPSHQPMAAFHANRDISYMSMPQFTGVPTLPTEGLKENHFSSGSVVQKYSQLIPQSRREGNHEKSLKTIEELHLDFVQQRQKMDKLSYFQPGQFQEEIFRGDDGILQGLQGKCKDILSKAPARSTRYY